MFTATMGLRAASSRWSLTQNSGNLYIVYAVKVKAPLSGHREGPVGFGFY